MGQYFDLMTESGQKFGFLTDFGQKCWSKTPKRGFQKICKPNFDQICQSKFGQNPNFDRFFSQNLVKI